MTMDYDGAVLAPVAGDVGLIAVDPAPPADEGSVLVLPAEFAVEGDAAFLADGASGDDDWLALALAGTSSDAITVSLADAAGWTLSPVSTDDEQVITVTGTRYPEDDWSGGGGSYTGSGTGDSGGTGGGSGPSDTEPNDCRDRKALEAEAAIKSDSDHKSEEHGAVIYRGADGALHLSRIFEGDGGQIDPDLVLTWLTQNGISISQVVGFAHNHDAWHYGQTTDAALINRYPSTGDWNFANYLVNRGAGGPGGSNFALYLIDTTDNMREFKYSDKTNYTKLSDDAMKRSVELPEELKSDGSSC